MSEYNCIQCVTLPGWDDEHPLSVKLRRPSILTMAAHGLIPNELLCSAQKLFCEGFDSELPIDQLGSLLVKIAEQALVEPTMAQLEECGCHLTDMQLAAIYNFTQAGVRALEPFRLGTAGARPAGDDQKILGSPE